MSEYDYNLGDSFLRVLTHNAGRPALHYAERSYTFAEIAVWIDALVAELGRYGCARGEVIAIGHTKRPLSYALMHAALRIGVAYVVLDVESPLERNAMILSVCRPKLLFFDDSNNTEVMSKLAARVQIRALLLDADMPADPGGAVDTPAATAASDVDGATIAYVMFTSGSTGVPKGVAVTHQNVLHFIAWGRSFLAVREHDNFANLSPMYFDNSVFDFYIGMFSGAALTPIPRTMLSAPYDLVAHIEAMKCTVWFSVPSLLMYLMTMKAIGASNLQTLRVIVFGGEGYPKVELRKLFELFGSNARLVNVYGPTECTCICSAHDITPGDFDDLSGLPTLGVLNPNFDYKIIDDDGREASLGELCLIGPNVAAGYFNDLERTNAAFSTLTEPDRFMKRMYRTGDRVELRRGLLYFMGRKDNQIKHMGYRIELEEIEHALVAHPAVDQAAAIYHRTGTLYGKLIAFVASKHAVDEKQLLAALGDAIPEYMVPSRLLVLAELPKNANGKVDKQALRALFEDGA